VQHCCDDIKKNAHVCSLAFQYEISWCQKNSQIKTLLYLDVLCAICLTKYVQQQLLTFATLACLSDGIQERMCHCTQVPSIFADKRNKLPMYKERRTCSSGAINTVIQTMNLSWISAFLLRHIIPPQQKNIHQVIVSH
jgi:hypothetical protein